MNKVFEKEPQMENEFDYYLIDSKDDETYPLIDIVARDDEENPSLISIEIGDPIPRKPVMDKEKFVLNAGALKEIPLEERLVFCLSEALSRVIFHKSVVDAIMAVNPTGIQFHPIENGLTKRIISYNE